MIPTNAKKVAEIPAPVVSQANNNQKALEAWFKAETDEQKAAAVKSFPELANIFSLANTIANTTKK